MNIRECKLCASILLLFLSIVQSLAAAQPATQVPPKPPLATRDLATLVRKSLVVIMTQDDEGNDVAQGSGFFFKPGLVATNLHVLKRASQGYVKSLHDGVSYKISSVVGFDLKHDICVLKLANAAGAPLPLSTAEVAVGDDILVAGNPEGLEASFSKGIVSGIRSGSGLIQMDAAISHGSSGGPVVNQRGEVVGLAVSSLVEGQNLNFAVPVRYLRRQKLVWTLEVKTVGVLAVPDLERDGFHGPVRSVTESEASYTRNEATHTKVEGPAVLKATSKYNRDGQIEEIINIHGGVEDNKRLWEYSDDGLIKREIDIDSQGRRESPDEYSAEFAVWAQTFRAEFETWHGHIYQKERLDRLPSSHPDLDEKTVRKYDSLGREIETLIYFQGELVTVMHYAYEDNEHGDWIREHDEALREGIDDGFSPTREYYRGITYWGEGDK